MVATSGHGIGLEQVGRHAGAVAHVVAHVVRDHRGVARVVFGDAGFHLAHQVGADVGTLGEDAAAQTGEDRNQRGTETKRHQGLDQVAAADVHDIGVRRSNRQRTEAPARPPACRSRRRP